MNLKELFEKHGQKWLTFPGNPPQKKFRPLGYSEDGQCIIGELYSKDHLDYTAYRKDNSFFILYQEPKPKVLRWQYVYTIDDGYPNMSAWFCKDEDDLKTSIGWVRPISRIKIIKRVEPPIECES